MKKITSRQNALVARFRAVARGDDAGVLLDGAHLVEEALSARAPIRHVAVTAEGWSRAEIRTLVEQAERRGSDVVSVSPAVMAAVSPVRSPGVIVAIADRPPVDGDRLFSGKPLVVVACDVQDPGNLGAIVRVAEASGATGVIATVPHGGQSIFEIDLTKPVAILIGGEGSGLSAPVIAGADERLTIPMEAPVESLNAAVTAALILYEARRQRNHGAQNGH